MKYTITRAEVTSTDHPNRVVWDATFIIDGAAHVQERMILSELPTDHETNDDHHSPDAAKALAACDPNDRKAIFAALVLDVERAGRELVIALAAPSTDLLASTVATKE